MSVVPLIMPSTMFTVMLKDEIIMPIIVPPIVALVTLIRGTLTANLIMYRIIPG